MPVFVTLLMAVIADQLLKEPKRFHPLVGFGCLAERWLNKGKSANNDRLFGLSPSGGTVRFQQIETERVDSIFEKLP